MLRLSREGALLLVPLSFASGCAQIIGIDDYQGPLEGSGGGQAGGMSAEECGDEVDNDGDGAIDCEDGDCGDHQCLPAAPTPWIGPVMLAIGDPRTLPNCPGGAPAFEGGTGTVTIPPADCPCTCDAAPTLNCGAQLRFSDTSDCGAATDVFGSGCLAVMPTGQYVSASTSMSGDPICNPTSVDPPLQSVTWPNMVRGCAADVGGGCGGLACVAAPFGFDRLCVYQLGNQACPAGEYSEAMVVERYNAASDLRACDVPCTCTPLSPGCGGSLKTFDTAGCVGQSFTIPNLACNDAGFVPASAEYIPMATGTCTPEVRTPTGTVVSFDTTTVCCKPL